MKPWHRAVAVPPVALLLGWSVALVYSSALSTPPQAPTRTNLERFLEPPLRHGGCQGRFWLADRTPLQPISQTSVLD